MRRQPFEAIVARHGQTVLRVCRAVLRPVDAEDAWSETFLAALKAFPKLPDDANVEAWLVTIAHPKAIDITRAEARREVPVAAVPERPSVQRTDGRDLDLKVLAILAARVSPRILNAPKRLDAAVREIDEYFAGMRHGFDLPLDFSLSKGFRRLVLDHLSNIAYGHTASYAGRQPGKSFCVWRQHDQHNHPEAEGRNRDERQERQPFEPMGRPRPRWRLGSHHRRGQ